jgi:hypothetical protein
LLPAFGHSTIPLPVYNVWLKCVADAGKGLIGKREPSLRELVEAASSVMTDEVLDATA